MLKLLSFVIFVMWLLGCQSTIDVASEHSITNQSNFAPKPLYVDPTYDGAADPVVIWNIQEKKWFMFYTNRRATMANAKGVEWVHGTPIGIAESTDGAHWQYKTDANIDYPLLKQDDLATYWAPDVFFNNGLYHMFLTIVPGVFQDWKHPRSIAHFSSENLLDWQYVSTLKLNSNRVIDADVVALPEGGYRMFYNDEPDGKSVYFADSPDLYHWYDQGKANLSSRGEGPTAFYWQGYWWLVVDAWQGLSVYRSEDLKHWQQQTKRLLEQPGTGAQDGVKGGHPDVIVNNGKAYLYYFVHPGNTEKNKGIDNAMTRRSVIQVTELILQDGWLTCDRNSDTVLSLMPEISNMKQWGR